eukprot:UN18588
MKLMKFELFSSLKKKINNVSFSAVLTLTKKNGSMLFFAFELAKNQLNFLF